MSVDAGADDRPGLDVPVLSIPDIRDYQRINAELIQHLDAGHRVVRLVGAEGQRLLVSGLKGAWEAVVEIEGRAGPELAAGLNAPGLRVLCHGPAADGAGSGLIAGELQIESDAGPALGYAQKGGTILVRGSCGPRAGLNQSGGLLIVLGTVGPLAGERQSGGLFYARTRLPCLHASRGQTGGRFLAVDGQSPIGPKDRDVLGPAMELFNTRPDSA